VASLGFGEYLPSNITGSTRFLKHPSFFETISNEGMEANAKF
jgi:hypothetical protein